VVPGSVVAKPRDGAIAKPRHPGVLKSMPSPRRVVERL
jgi:hypothetical protein